MALMVISVSSKDSPFDRLLAGALKSMDIIPRRFSASSKEIRVRVLFSKNIFTAVNPFRVSYCGARPAFMHSRL